MRSRRSFRTRQNRPVFETTSICARRASRRDGGRCIGNRRPRISVDGRNPEAGGFSKVGTLPGTDAPWATLIAARRRRFYRAGSKSLRNFFSRSVPPPRVDGAGIWQPPLLLFGGRSLRLRDSKVCPAPYSQADLHLRCLLRAGSGSIRSLRRFLG